MYPQQPASPATHRRRGGRGRKTILAATIPAALVLAGGGGYLALHQTGGTAGKASVPGAAAVAGKDPGIAVCEQLRDNMALASASAAAATGARGQQDIDNILGNFDQKAFTEGLKELRARLAASRYPAIRDNGLKFVDVLLRPASEKMNDSPEEALEKTGEYFDAFNGMLDGCREEGVPVQTLKDLLKQEG